jgi:thymidylate synthase
LSGNGTFNGKGVRQLKLEFIEARDLPEAWFLCIRRVVEVGYDYPVDRGSFEKVHQRKGFDYVTVHIKYPGTRPLIPDIPPGLGLEPPVTMEYVEAYATRYLMSSVREQGEDYTYGEDLEKQWPEVIKMYQEQGFGTNQACMSVGNADSIFLGDPQCLRVVDTRIRYGKLYFIVYFRSWDLWNGFPANLAALQLMKEEMVREISKVRPVEDGGIIASSKCLHLYDYAWPLAEIRLHLGNR